MTQIQTTKSQRIMVGTIFIAAFVLSARIFFLFSVSDRVSLTDCHHFYILFGLEVIWEPLFVIAASCKGNAVRYRNFVCCGWCNKRHSICDIRGTLWLGAVSNTRYNERGQGNAWIRVILDWNGIKFSLACVANSFSEWNRPIRAMGAPASATRFQSIPIQCNQSERRPERCHPNRQRSGSVHLSTVSRQNCFENFTRWIDRFVQNHPEICVRQWSVCTIHRKRRCGAAESTFECKFLFSFFFTWMLIVIWS